MRGATGGLRRLRVDLAADEHGQFAAVRLTPFEGFLLSLTTTPGEPSPSGPFNVELRDRGYDVTEGCGRGRPADVRRSSIVRYARPGVPDAAINRALDTDRLPPGFDTHPVVDESDVLMLHVDGNRVPGARLRVELIYGTGG